MVLKQYLRHSVTNTILARLLSALFKMGLVVLTAQLFGPEGRGFISLFVYVMTFFMLANEFVGGSSLINLVYKDSLKNLLYPSYLWAFLVCLVGTALLPLFSAVEAQWYLHIFFLSLLLACITINYSLLIGKRKLILQNWLTCTLACIHLLVVFLFYKFASEKVDVVIYLYGMYVAEILVLLISVYVLYTNFKEEFVGQFKWNKLLFKDGVEAQFAQVLKYLSYRLSYIFILKYLTEGDLGVYATAFVLCDLIWIFGKSIATVLHLSIVNESDREKAKRQIKKYTLLSSAISLALILFILFLPGELWVWLLGSGFGQIKELFIWLAPGVLALGIATCIEHYYHSVRNFRFLILANLLGLAVKFIYLFSIGKNLTLVDVSMATSAGLIALSAFVLFGYQYRTIFVRKGI